MPEQDDAAPDAVNSPLVFPTDFPIKVMGRATEDFAQQVVSVVRAHSPDFDPATLEIRTSKEGNWLSLTATIRATSRAQLDALYRDLTAHPEVKVVL